MKNRKKNTCKSQLSLCVNFCTNEIDINDKSDMHHSKIYFFILQGIINNRDIAIN